jgi:hypothetical protein
MKAREDTRTPRRYRDTLASDLRDSVLECGCPLPLSATSDIHPRVFDILTTILYNSPRERAQLSCPKPEISDPFR